VETPSLQIREQPFASLSKAMYMSLQLVVLTLQNMIFAPKLDANLLSVGHMTSSNDDMVFSKSNTSLLLDGEIITRGKKINNLFTYMALSPLQVTKGAANYYGEPNSLTLWHHRLAHTAPLMIERMWKMETAEGVSSVDVSQEMCRCVNCPFGKQTHLPFKRIKLLPERIGDTISSDLGGPFEMSIRGYKYFITWIDHKTHYSSVEFLKNKECATITRSFKGYIPRFKRQKGRM
jgi:hypothetical protein